MFVLKKIRAFLDSPKQNEQLLPTNTIEIVGWACSRNSPIESVTIWLDETLQGDAFTGFERLDVFTKYPKYVNAKISGFRFTLKLPDQAGSYDLLIKIKDTKGELKTIRQPLFISEPTFRLTLDDLQHKWYRGSLQKIAGQYTTHHDNLEHLTVYLDDRVVGLVHKQAISKISTDTFAFTFDFTVNATVGEHQLRVVGTDSKDRQYQVSKNIMIQDSLIEAQLDDMYIEIQPDMETIQIAGWAFSKVGAISQVIATIDEACFTAKLNLLRTDIASQHEHPRALMSGFEIILPVKDLPKKDHMISYEVTDAVGNKRSLKQKILNSGITLSAEIPTSPLTTLDSSQVKGQVHALYSDIETITAKIDGIQCDVIRNVSRPKKVQEGDENNKGEEFVINIPSLTEGRYRLNVKVTDTHGSSKDENYEVEVADYAPQITVDSVIYKDNYIYLDGWVMFPNTHLPHLMRVWHDDILIGETRCNLSRPEIHISLPENVREFANGFIFHKPFSIENKAKSISLRIEVCDFLELSIERIIQVQVPKSQPNHDYIAGLHDILRQIEQSYGNRPIILNWSTNQEIKDVLSQWQVFSPLIGNKPTLPYFDNSIDIVILTTQSKAHVAEAKRVARIAIITIKDNIPLLDWVEQTVPDFSLPSASIIIPVYNQWAFTSQCLDQLALTLPSDFDGEVIVINDKSNDETVSSIPAYESKYDWLKVIHNDENLGFLRTCNRAASEAKHQILVFLNNDTLPQDNWLTAILSPFVERENVGAVGGKLIYPNYTLQEAGGVAFSNGRCWNFGKHSTKMNHPLFNHSREVDYCSGALLATPRELFLELDKFDERYIPAYYEDTDYCFKVRQHGLSVLYQPESVAIHFESISYGDELASDNKKYRAENIKKFAEKWHDILQLHHAHQSEYSMRTLSKLVTHHQIVDGELINPRRVLVVCPTMPEFDRECGSLRTYHMIETLNLAGWSVTVLINNMTDSEYYARKLRQQGIMVYGTRHSRYIGDEYIHDPIQLIQTMQFDLALLLFWHIAEELIPIFRQYSPQTKLMVDSVDLHYLRSARRRVQQEKIDTQRKSYSNVFDYQYADIAMREMNAYVNADKVLTVSDKETHTLRDLFGLSNHVKTLPLHAKKPNNLHTINPLNHRGILFVGNFRHPPNIDAINYFVGDILPLLPARLLQEHPLYIVGNNAEALNIDVQKFGDGVRLIGWVPTLDVYLKHAKVAVVPLRYGAGVKCKMIDAMSHGLPTVTTSIGAEGMALGDKEHVLIANDPQTFATAIQRVIEDDNLWQHLNKNSMDFIQENHSDTMIQNKFLDIINTLFE